MASLNQTPRTAPIFTHEGGRAAYDTPFNTLRRTVMTCMLWEDRFYEDGEQVADRIKRLVHSVSLEAAAFVAVEARNIMKLRHVPLLIVREMARHPKRNTSKDLNAANHTSWISKTLAEIIQRADELSEFLAIYWKDGKEPLSKQVKLGLAKAFQKFNEYDLAKYNRNKEVKLRDVLFLCHSKPADVNDERVWTKETRKLFDENPGAAQRRLLVQTGHGDGFTEGELLYGKLIYDQLETPDTWEVELSKSKDKSASWVRLLNEKKLGDLAFLRNLRNLRDAGISDFSIKAYGDERRWGRVLPFRFIAAARMNPSLEHVIEPWMLKCMENQPKLPGKTVFLVDVSGSMFGTKVSAKSDLDRFDAAAALAVLGRELCEEVAVLSFSSSVVQVPARRGFGLIDAINRSQGHSATCLGAALDAVTQNPYDRIIVITDEQSADTGREKLHNTYIINVGGYENSLKYEGEVTRISGWSESVFDFIQMLESEKSDKL